MRSPLHGLLASVLVTAPVLTADALATPYLPADIVVGATVTGSFFVPIVTTDAVPDPMRGGYTVPDAQMRVRVGGAEFSTAFDPMFVQVLDQQVGGDWIQLFASGNEATFAPYLSNFGRQNSRLQPLGTFVLNFQFPSTHLASDAFPATIDPLATVPFRSGRPPSGIIGQVEGLSLQRPNAGIREWAFHFYIDPLDIAIVAGAGAIGSTFAGTVYNVDDRVVVGTPSPIPEPASIVMFVTGLLGLGRLARRSRRS
jgi:hypothetical protein